MEIELIELSRASHRYAGLRRLAVLVVALVAVGCGGERAMASCGDYLLDRGMLDHPMPAERSAASGTPSESGTPMSPPPCEGPSCRQMPLAPTAPAPASPSAPELERWCVTAVSGMLGDAPVVGCWEKSGIVLPAAPVARIDRPPQA